MRCALVLAGLVGGAAPAAAEDAYVSVGAAVGAGGQGAASYGGLDLRLDAAWRDVRIGLGARGVWLGGEFRARDWERAVDAVRVVRQLEAHAGPAALAAGALSPTTLGLVARDYHASLDDRARTGVRGSVLTRAVEAIAEIDDVLDPAVVGAALAWQVRPPWGIRATFVADPYADRGAGELGFARRWQREGARLELGGAVVGEHGDGNASGLGIVGFASTSLDYAAARWTATADVRAGTGTNGAAFGPLYRIERAAILDDVHGGAAMGLSLGVVRDGNWLALGGRTRRNIGSLGTFALGAPMNRWVQAAAWFAASPKVTAGAAELRVTWAQHLYSALEVARMYLPIDDMSEDMSAPLRPAWSATVWFGAATL